MQHLILCQGEAQAEVHSHAGVGPRCTASTRRCSSKTWLRPTSFLLCLLGPQEAIYKEFYPRLNFSLLLQHYYFLVSAFSCPKDTGSAPVAHVHLGKTEPFVTVRRRAVHSRSALTSHCSCSESCKSWKDAQHAHCKQPFIIAELRSRHNPASCSGCVHQRGTSHPLPATSQWETRAKTQKARQVAVDYGFCCKNDILSLSLSSRKAQCCKGGP